MSKLPRTAAVESFGLDPVVAVVPIGASLTHPSMNIEMVARIAPVARSKNDGWAVLFLETDVGFATAAPPAATTLRDLLRVIAKRTLRRVIMAPPAARPTGPCFVAAHAGFRVV